MKSSRLYIIVIIVVFVALAVVFLCLPRSVYSELEKRDLATFPEFSFERVRDGKFMSDLSHWFSDTEPYRDEFMSLSMNVRDRLRFNLANEEEAITFHATDSKKAPAPGADASAADIAGYENHITAEENAKIASAGIIIIGSAPKARALNAFGGEASGGGKFVDAVSEYAKSLPGVKVYAMVIPLSSEFYTPDKAKSTTKPQLPFIKSIYSRLSNGARGVNAYTPLAEHVQEDIYLRTDHHWAPLGAYYAAQAFASEAGVPFRDLSAYDRKVVKGYIGSMYGYSKDISIKNSPEDFVYYVPKSIGSTSTTYRDYKVNEDYQVTSEGPEAKGNFFYHYKDGSSGAYCTFMGGDQRLTHVKTDVNNGRRLIIIKDSYGNPVPSFLFYSFEDIYVVDFRYFTHNMKKFVKDKGVTDILFAVNVFNAYSGSAAEKMKRFLTQPEGTFSAATPPPAKSEATSTAATPTVSTPAKSPVDPAPAPKSTPNEAPKEYTPKEPTPAPTPTESSDE